MSDLTRLGSNIRYLREAFGETQEDLGRAINVQKTTISNYENGIREPDKESLTRIAQHYMISVDELIYSNYSDLCTINMDTDAFWKKIDIILPLLSSERMMQNKHFRKAYVAQKELFAQLSRGDISTSDCIDLLFSNKLSNIENEYELAVSENKETSPEIAANLIAITFLLWKPINDAVNMLTQKPAPFVLLMKINKQVRDHVLAIEPDQQKEMEKVLKELSNIFCSQENKEQLNEYLITIKKSQWSDLAYYYIALQYTWNIVSNDLPLNLNKRIGEEMLKAFALMENRYALEYWSFTFEVIGARSSHIVDTEKV